MPTHILVNKLGLTYKSTIGLSTATLPDVCKTPSPGGPVPIPYPNFANQGTLTKGTKTVKAKNNKMIAVKGSRYAMSTGDEPGTVGGVKSSTFKQHTDWITYSFDVKMDGKNACRHTDKKFHNKKNTVNLAGGIDPLAVVTFEEILKKCVKSARDSVDGKNPTPPQNDEEWREYCKKNKKQRGIDIGKEAEQCVRDEMAAQNRSDEVAFDQSYTGPPPKATGKPGEVIDGTARPDVVLHQPGDPNAVRGVYDFKATCPPSNMPEWGERGAFDQGENYIRTFQQAPKLVSPGWRAASYATGKMKVVAELLGVPL